MDKRTWAHLHLPRYLDGNPDCISIKVKGERIDYTDHITLVDVEFVVSEKARQRTLATGQRNVHAWVVGTPASIRTWGGAPRKAVYDPFKGGTFVDAATLQPVHTARIAWLRGKDVFYAA